MRPFDYLHFVLLSAIFVLIIVRRQPVHNPPPLNNVKKVVPLYFFWVGDRLINLGQVAFFNRKEFEVKLNSGDVIVMEKDKFEDFLAWIDIPDEIKIPKGKNWGPLM